MMNLRGKTSLSTQNPIAKSSHPPQMFSKKQSDPINKLNSA